MANRKSDGFDIIARSIKSAWTLKLSMYQSILILRILRPHAAVTVRVRVNEKDERRGIESSRWGRDRDREGEG